MQPGELSNIASSTMLLHLPENLGDRTISDVGASQHADAVADDEIQPSDAKTAAEQFRPQLKIHYNCDTCQLWTKSQQQYLRLLYSKTGQPNEEQKSLFEAICRSMGPDALQNLDYPAYAEDSDKKLEIKNEIAILEKNERLSLSNQLQSQLQGLKADYQKLID